MGKKIRVGLNVPMPTDPTSWYRGIGPWASLQKDFQDVEIVSVGNDWGSIKQCDVLFLQRPALFEHMNALLTAKDLQVPVWVDFDDDNLSVPKDNPMYNIYGQQPIRDNIVKLTRFADVVTVTTNFLKQKYRIYNENIFVVPNAVDDCVVHLKGNTPNTPREKNILWRGLGSHTRNLELVEDNIAAVASRHLDWTFGFLGIDPFRVTDVVKNAKAYGAVDPQRITEYFKAIIGLHPTMVYYPMGSNTDHQKARSHVAWLEATQASALMVASDFEEFHRPGIINFKTGEELEAIIEAVIKGEVDIDKHVTESWKCIEDKYLLSRTNQTRYEILRRFI